MSIAGSRAPRGLPKMGTALGPAALPTGAASRCLGPSPFARSEGGGALLVWVPLLGAISADSSTSVTYPVTSSCTCDKGTRCYLCARGCAVS